jgi:hypothetical protein
MKNIAIKQFSIRSIIFTGLLAAAFFAAGFARVEAHEGAEDGDCRTRSCRTELVAARQATAKYHDFQTAVNEGYVQLSPCVEIPGVGAMGFHYGNWERIMNPNADATEPEVLLYLPDEDGVMRLVALEYVVPQTPNTPAPVLFGQHFGFNPNLGAYALHVWAWRDNPEGVFKDFNSKLSCPQQ